MFGIPIRVTYASDSPGGCRRVLCCRRARARSPSRGTGGAPSRRSPPRGPRRGGFRRSRAAGARAKPDGVLIVEPGAEEAFLRSCTLAEIPLVGPKLQARLQARGLITVEDVFPHDVGTLRQRGELSAREATWLWHRVHGVDA